MPRIPRGLKEGSWVTGSGRQKQFAYKCGVCGEMKASKQIRRQVGRKVHFEGSFTTGDHREIVDVEGVDACRKHHVWDSEKGEYVLTGR